MDLPGARTGHSLLSRASRSICSRLCSQIYLHSLGYRKPFLRPVQAGTVKSRFACPLLLVSASAPAARTPLTRCVRNKAPDLARVPATQVGVRPSGGLRLWDVRFAGVRIVYELSLQEAMVSFGGTTPSQVRVSTA